MPKHYDSMYVECPFFRYYDGAKLSCEGIEADTSTHVVFSSPEKRRAYMKAKCQANHKGCIIAKALYDFKYPDKKE